MIRVVSSSGRPAGSGRERGHPRLTWARRQRGFGTQGNRRVGGLSVCVRVRTGQTTSGPRWMGCRDRMGLCIRLPDRSSRARRPYPPTAADPVLRRRSPGADLPTPILPAREPSIQPGVSVRGRRDPRPHPRHLLRHPDLHRAALPGAAALDGADPGAGAVRAGRQAHPPLGRLQPRRHRGVQPARDLDERPHAVHQAGDRRAGRHGGGQGRWPRLRQRRRARRAVHVRQRRGRQRAHGGVPGPDPLGGPRGAAVRDGRPSPAVGGLAPLRPHRRLRRGRPGVPALLADHHVPDPPDARPTPTSQRRPDGPPAEP